MSESYIELTKHHRDCLEGLRNRMMDWSEILTMEGAEIIKSKLNEFIADLRVYTNIAEVICQLATTEKGGDR